MEFKVGNNKDKYLHPSELKDGDFIKIENRSCSYIYIFKKYINDVIYRYASLDLEDKSLNTCFSIKWGIFSSSDKITYATEEEKNLLNRTLIKKGYIWDNINKKLVKIGSVNLTSETNIGTVEISQEYLLSDCISRVNPAHIPSHTKYGVFVDTDKEELNLFPTKKHYQLNFNINN